MKTGGLNLRVGTFPGGLWYDSKPTANIAPGWGINLAFLAGAIHWDMPKFWKKDAWKNKYASGGVNIWFTLKIPAILPPWASFLAAVLAIYGLLHVLSWYWAIGVVFICPGLPYPFVSVSLGKIGFYIGFKQNGWGDNTTLLPSARSTSRRDI